MLSGREFVPSELVHEFLVDEVSRRHYRVDQGVTNLRRPEALRVLDVQTQRVDCVGEPCDWVLEVDLVPVPRLVSQVNSLEPLVLDVDFRRVSPGLDRRLLLQLLERLLLLAESTSLRVRSHRYRREETRLLLACRPLLASIIVGATAQILIQESLGHRQVLLLRLKLEDPLGRILVLERGN